MMCLQLYLDCYPWWLYLVSGYIQTTWVWARSTSLNIIGSVAYWVLSGTFIAIVWLTRLSLVCSLLRIIPRSIRPIAYIASAVFSLMGIALFIQEITLCHSDTSWESLGGMNLQCSGNQAIMATEIALEFFSNIALVTMLIRIIAIFKTVALRRLVILAILIGSLLISGGSIAHAVYLIQNTGLLARFTASIQASSSLIIIKPSSVGRILLIAHRSKQRRS
ncbi:hypothetical protein BT96DRAFT_624375 [Gymnopus androsaceus JB14]|uniref:Uncharacterized protein n=1 Tax=Gymnopus androsaceus JB14 TaxID=1447944 RepID=A0A6A4IHV6_9AGAR|nr:hypothetical protein BT96DRAFT_624375 [Gymnopus androsaceus JB14]